MNKQIMLVDDESNLLQSLRRSLRGHHELTLAIGGQEAINLIRSRPTFAVIVCDMQMPEISGLDVLRFARQHSPDTTRIMLTGNVDQQTAVDAINSGAIFRFLNKPCAADSLRTAIDEGLRQFQLTLAEKELLSQTVRGAVSLVTDVMALANPDLANRGSQTSHLARRLASFLNWEDAWQYEVAAMLAQIGGVGDPPFNQEKSDQLSKLAASSSQMVRQIPRLESVADIIQHQCRTNLPDDVSQTIRQGSTMLRMLHEFNVLRDNHTVGTALEKLGESPSCDEKILSAIKVILLEEMSLMSVSVVELVAGMVLEDDLLTKKEVPLLRKGTELTLHLLERISSIQNNSEGIQEPINVRVVTSPNATLSKTT